MHSTLSISAVIAFRPLAIPSSGRLQLKTKNVNIRIDAIRKRRVIYIIMWYLSLR